MMANLKIIFFYVIYNNKYNNYVKGLVGNDVNFDVEDIFMLISRGV